MIYTSICEKIMSQMLTSKVNADSYLKTEDSIRQTKIHVTITSWYYICFRIHVTIIK
uniref:Uncharacterized protein n=1 Tax=Arundo donax TaxID=35708 RepID=A0A0A9H370_ARUDO